MWVLIGFFVAIGFGMLTKVVLQNKLECWGRAVYRSIRTRRVVAGHRYKLYYTGANYNTGAKDVQILKCIDCGGISVGYNFNPDEES